MQNGSIKAMKQFCLLGLRHVNLIPEQFLKCENGNKILLAMKLVDVMLLTGTDDARCSFIDGFSSNLNHGDIVHSPGVLRFYALNIIQSEDLSVSNHANDRLTSIEPHPISWTGF